MLKVSFFSGENELGPTVVPLFNRATDSVLEKIAAPSLLPDVVKYIESLRPRQDAVYNLVNALGAGEFFGSNINGDFFPEAALIHAPDTWTGNPLLDKVRSKDWPYGYPTFYYAHPYAHHRNKDASRAFGEVELAVWNDRMKRVELVTRVDKDKCEQFGGTQVWDKLKAGQFPDVSMGCKVPYDTCSICLDLKKYREAQGNYDPKRHKHPGDAVLEAHRKNKITGVAVTRSDYCEHTSKQMSRILKDGRKVWVYNDYPKFFDISFVFIGADKTAKTMMKIAGAPGAFWDIGSSAEMAEKLGYREDGEKNASSKSAVAKQSEITKDIVPSQFAGKAVPVLTSREEDLPRDLLDLMGRAPLETSLSTSGSLGIVLRPREFQRVVLVHIGKKDLADDMDAHNEVFSRSSEKAPMELGLESILPALAKLLLPFVASRSALAPAIERRVVVVSGAPAREKKASSSLSSELLRKIASAYNGYRSQLMELAAHAQDVLGKVASPSDTEFRKLSAAAPDQVFTPLTVAYLKTAFLDEVGHERNEKQARAGVERGFPSRNT